MKFELGVALSIAVVACSAFLLQGQTNGFPPSSRIISRQGWPDQADVIGHRHISKGSHVKCIQVEHHPKHVDDGAACLLRLDSGNKQILGYGQDLQVQADGEMYLECAGDRPTRCTVGVW